MFSKTSFLLPIILLVFSSSFGQMNKIEENIPVIIDGIEYSYVINNEQTKTIKEEEYSRFEITLFVTNKSGCTKLFADHISFNSQDAPNLIATFICSNANGRRLTAKSAPVKVRDFFVNVKIHEGEKEVSRSTKAGYIFGNGETIKTNIIVLVPKEERPMISFNANYLQELR